MATPTAPHIFLVVPSLGFGGSERQALELMRAAHPDHARFTVICLAEAGANADEARALGIPVHVLGVRRPKFHPGLIPYARLLRRERPDVVYALLFQQYAFALPLAAAILPSVRRVAGRRNQPEHDITPFLGAEQAVQLANACSHHVIANSESVRSAWERHNPSLSGHVSVVENGIRLPDVEPAQLEPGRLHVTSVGRLQTYKGQRDLVEAATRLGARDDWTLHLVGDGDDRATIEAQLARSGLNGRVVMHGTQPSERVHALVKASDLTVLPSHTEGLPNTVMESMAHGVAAVATDVGGVRGLLESGAGTIVPPNEPAALADAIAAMLDDPAKRAAAGAEGRRVIESRYSVATLRDKTLEVMHRVIADGKRAQPT